MYELTTSDNVPMYRRMPGIVSGYIVIPNCTYMMCMSSLFTFHNESCNAWTMVLLSAVALFMSNMNNGVAEQLLCASTLIHMPFSVCCSLFIPMGEEVFKFWHTLDAMAMCLTAIPMGFSLGMGTLPMPLLVLNTVATAYMGCESAHHFWKAHNSSKKKKRCLAQTFKITGVVICFTFPLVYTIAQDGASKKSHYALCTLAGYASAGLLYSSKVPERWFPGMFDYFGSSHNLMHIILILVHVGQFSWLKAS